MTPLENNVLKSKICCACKKEKEITSFYRNAAMHTGWEARCKLCKQNKLKCRKPNGTGRKSKPLVLPSDLKAPMLFNVVKEDWIDMYEFLKSIGYSLDRNIHEQFCEKHNLKTRKRMYERSQYFSPEDLGLV
jgi:hypothetical protein